MRQGRSPLDFGDYRFALSDTEYVSGSLLAVEAQKALVSQYWFERLAALCRELLDFGRSRFLARASPNPVPVSFSAVRLST